MAKTDEKLVREFLSGNEIALENLIEKYLKPIYNFTFQMTRDTGASEDITQDVFVKVWKNINSFDETKKFSTWIFAIAKNSSLDWLKKKKTVPFAFFERVDGSNILEYIEDQNVICSNELLQKMDNAKEAQKYLDSLSLESKTILLLHHAQGFSLVEVAEILRSPRNTVKSKYRRAIMSLRSLYLNQNGLSTKDAPKNIQTS